jgi:UDP-N-acetylmuramoyl-L-alanyl-D-glutamate--2,6-diaminopimelate ligase
VRVPGCAGPQVYVDYAHTPDAVERAIEALRPSTRGRLIVLLGCGGDRDPGKRPLMGAIASRGASRFVATSDNPRTEDPEAILDQMLAGAVAGAEVVREVDRAKAIALAIADAREDDVVLIAGKGHEDYQILGTTKIHFDDREHAEAALRRR